MKRTQRNTANMSNEIVICETDDTICGTCYAEFLDPEDLKVHIEQVHPSGNLVACQFCDKKLSDALNYVLHIRDCHLMNFSCCWACNRIFTDFSQYRKHTSVHPQSMCDGTYPCSQCGQYFLHKTELRHHEMENHYDCKEGVFLNKYYPLLSSVINMKAEIVVLSAGKDQIYNCLCCKYNTANLEVYITHLKNSNCRSFVCELCCKIYKRKGKLAAHVVQHLKGNIVAEPSRGLLKPKPKQCSLCCDSYENIKKHTCNKTLKCGHCNTIFYTMYELTEHQTKVHPLAVALMVCQFCRREFVGSVALEKHMDRTHSHELHMYKYNCSYCDTVFKHPQRLFAHYFLKHKDINPYLCKICDKPFRVRKGFTLHIKLVHKSEGFVEFDERLHVFFTDKKSEKPFQPVSKYVQEKPTDVDGVKNKDSDKTQDIILESDANPTDTEGNQVDTRKRPCRKRKKDNLDDVAVLSDYDSDDEPLVEIKKKAKLKLQLRRRPLELKKKGLKKTSKNQFTCKICKKYCYTFQNYQNHVNMHFRDEAKKCIKCSLSFKSKTDLQRHMTEQHSSSQLTETLKNILERRKQGEQKEEISPRRKFRNTIKKVAIEKDEVTATLRQITKEMSVQKFIENFTPEGSEKKNIQIQSSISMTKVTNPIERPPMIKMTKFKPAPEIQDAHIKLAMPVRFKRCNEQHSVTVTMRKVHMVTEPISNIKFTYDDNQYQDDDNDYDESYQEHKDTNIPEVEQEVTLATEEVPKRNPATHKIVIPKLPKELKTLRIAHLLPEAPYYKIVKVADIIKSQEEKKEEQSVEEVQNADVRLPDGTKLVHVNPLAHLLGNTPVDHIIKPSKYKPKPRNFEAVLAKALRKLDEVPPKQIKKKKTEQPAREKSNASKSGADKKTVRGMDTETASQSIASKSGSDENTVGGMDTETASQSIASNSGGDESTVGALDTETDSPSITSKSGGDVVVGSIEIEAEVSPVGDADTEKDREENIE